MPPVNIFSYSLSLRYSLLARSPFVTAIQASALEFGALRKFVAVLTVELPPWRRPILMTTLKDRTLSPAAEVFMTCVRDLCRPLR